MAGSVQTKSSAVTAGVQIMPTARAGYLHLCQITAAAAAATLVVYDNASSASGQVYEISAPVGQTIWYDWGGALQIQNGLWIVVTGTGATARLSWE